MSEFSVEILEELGRFTSNLQKLVLKIPREGSSVKEIVDFVEAQIFKANYLPAFPCTVSINDVAAHYTIFDDDYFLQRGDLVKIDFGVAHEGFITDNAITIEISTSTYSKMLEANKKALDRAVEIIDVGIKVSEIGREVNKIAETKGFNTIHNLSGHQIGRNNLHCGISLPNYDNGSLKEILQESEFAIEPFFTKGEPKVKSGGPSNILHLVKDGNVRDPIAKKILLFIRENFNPLPFSKRWLLKENISKLGIKLKSAEKGFEIKKVNYAINILKSLGILYEYDCLKSVDGSYISQFEDTVLFADGKKIVLTRL